MHQAEVIDTNGGQVGVHPVSHCPTPALPRCRCAVLCDAHIWDDGLGQSCAFLLGSPLSRGGRLQKGTGELAGFSAQLDSKGTLSSWIILFAQPRGSSFIGNRYSLVTCPRHGPRGIHPMGDGDHCPSACDGREGSHPAV